MPFACFENPPHDDAEVVDGTAVAGARTFTIAASLAGAPVSRYRIILRRVADVRRPFLSAKVNDSQGRHVLAIPSDDYVWVVLADAGAASRMLTVKDSVNAINIDLAPYASVGGSFVDARSGKPIAAAIELRVEAKELRAQRAPPSHVWTNWIPIVCKAVADEEGGSFWTRFRRGAR